MAVDRAQQDRLDRLQRDPGPLYETARQADGITYVAELGSWLVARDADVRDVLDRPEDFSSAEALRPDVVPSPAALALIGAGGGGGTEAGGEGGAGGGGALWPVVLTSDGALHRQLREPLLRGLAPSRVAAVLPYAAERAAALVDAFAADGRVELMSAYATKLPGDVIGRIAGLDPAVVPAVVQGVLSTGELLLRPLDEAGQTAAVEDVAVMRRLLDACVRDHRVRPRESLCGELIASVAPGGGGQLTPGQRQRVVARLVNALLGGVPTTAALIGTTVLHLLRDRRQWELLCDRPERIPAAVEEAARYDGPVQGLRRVTTRAVTLAGTELPAGSSLFVAFGSADRDGARHPRPETFDVGRAPAGHLAFGSGTHSCPGRRLAVEQVRIALEELTRRLPGLRLAEGEPVTMRPSLIARSPEALHLTW